MKTLSSHDFVQFPMTSDEVNVNSGYAAVRNPATDSQALSHQFLLTYHDGANTAHINTK